MAPWRISYYVGGQILEFDNKCSTSEQAHADRGVMMRRRRVTYRGSVVVEEDVESQEPATATEDVACHQHCRSFTAHASGDFQVFESQCPADAYHEDLAHSLSIDHTWAVSARTHDCDLHGHLRKRQRVCTPNSPTLRIRYPRCAKLIFPSIHIQFAQLQQIFEKIIYYLKHRCRVG